MKHFENVSIIVQFYPKHIDEKLFIKIFEFHWFFLKNVTLSYIKRKAHITQPFVLFWIIINLGLLKNKWLEFI